MSGQAPLVADCPPAVEEEAQRIAAQLIARGAAAPTAGLTDVQPVDVDSLRLVRPRSVGVEQVGLRALEQLDLPALLTRLGVNGALRSAATGAIVGRLAAPASERATHRWLQERSGLGELLGVDFETVGAMQLYRASDVLVKHREAIEAHLFDRAMGLFDLQPTVTLYDLTNTYFEGEASDQPQAQRGHSKEKLQRLPRCSTLGHDQRRCGSVASCRHLEGLRRQRPGTRGRWPPCPCRPRARPCGPSASDRPSSSRPSRPGPAAISTPCSTFSCSSETGRNEPDPPASVSPPRTLPPTAE